MTEMEFITETMEALSKTLVVVREIRRDAIKGAREDRANYPQTYQKVRLFWFAKISTSRQIEKRIIHEFGNVLKNAGVIK